MNLRISFIVSIVLLFSLGSAFEARAENDFGRTGPYLRGGVAAAFDLTTLLADFTDTGVGLGVAGGYRFHRFFAVEGLYEWLGKTDLGTGSTNVATVRRYDVTANLKVSTAGRFQPYAVVGIGYGNYKVSSNSSSDSAAAGGFVARFGGGFDVYIVRSIALYAEGAYMLTTGDIDFFDYATLGAGAKFRF